MTSLLKAAASVTSALICTAALAGGPLRVALVGDPQVDNAVEMGYARKSIYSELSGRKDIDLCIFLGDLVNDDMSLLPESVRIIDSLPFPCLMIPGNHDRDVYRGPKALHLAGASEIKRGGQQKPGKPRDLSSWRKTVGYVDTSFVRGNVRFILMNNVRHAGAGMTDYEGGFTSAQKHWLDSVLNVSVSGCRRGTRKDDAPALTILATHIPFSMMHGKDSVLEMIPDLSRMLFISGHTHYVSRGYIGDPEGASGLQMASELIAGAACGSWWRGVKDDDGVPYALQSCGAPRGYFIADIRPGGGYRLSYKCIGRPEPEQLSVWAIPENSASAEPSQGNAESGQDSDSIPRYRFYINVFGGASDGVTEISIPRKYRRGVKPSGFRQLHCTRSSATAPEVEDVIRFNASMTREYRKTHRDEFIPLRRKSSTHLWQSDAVLQGELPSNVNVRYRDGHMRLKMVNVRVQTFN